MNKLLAAAAAVSALIASGAAQAQEWTGFYVGANVGYGTGDDSTTEVSDGGIPSGFSQGFDIDGWTLGGYAGARWDAGGWIWGIEGDIDWANIEGGYRLVSGNGTDMETSWIGSIRGVAGVPMGGWLLYGTGGVAFGEVDYTYINATGPVTESTSDTETGWTAGVGAEWEMWGGHPRLEIRYTDLGDPSRDSATAYPPFTYEHEPAFTSVRFGMAWGLN